MGAIDALRPDGLKVQPRDLTIDNPAQQVRLNNLDGLIEQRLTVIAKTIELARGGKKPEAFAIAGRSDSKATMEQFRSQIAEIKAAENQLLTEREASSTRLETRVW